MEKEIKEEIKEEKVYYKRLDMVRIIACVIVLLYHLHIVKGGYLAVCTFFVLTGYLTTISAYKKEKLSLKEYYISRLKNIYVPFAIVVYISIIFFSIVPNMNWFQMKPESISALLGYNNYWQLGANSNYFTKQMNSPFIHFWYISILLQFDLIFPLLFIGIRKLTTKMKNWVPCLVITLLAINYMLYFCVCSGTKDLMEVYYGTFTRIFSILFGCVIATIQHRYKNHIFQKGNSIIFTLYLIALCILYVSIDSSSPYWAIAMIVTTLLSCRLIQYGTVITKRNSFLKNFVKKVASISYEVFLVQCPIIYYFQTLNVDDTLKNICIIDTVLVIATIIHFLIHSKGKNKMIQYIFKTILVGVVVAGNYYLITAKDHSKEIKELEEQMAQNAALIETRNTEYASKIQKEQEEWEEILNNLQNDEQAIDGLVKELPIVGIGDSVMLGAVSNLYEYFPNGYFDAKVSRSIYGVNSIVENLKSSGKLGNPVVFNLGANGEGSKKTRDQVISTVGEDKMIFWLTVTNDQNVHVNSSIKDYPNQYSNMHIIDWNAISNGHSDYFYADGLHLTPAGRKAYAKAVYDAVYEEYLKEYQEKKAEIIRKHEEELKNKTIFYGNEFLIYFFDYLQEGFEDSNFVSNNEFDFELLKTSLKEKIQNNTLEHKIVLMFDTNAHFTKENYEEIIALCEGHEIYIVKVDTTELDFQNENVKVIDYYNELMQHEEYFSKDKIHLSLEGSLALKEMLKTSLSKNQE